ncbi:hypothetical protein BLOT_005368 [Blomia tropicalis]|nr:hypothetical protein BLOT_005368 [Blomia tropicalis]
MMMAFGNRYRFVIAFLIFCSTTAIYIGRINLSIAIVEMSLKSNKTNNNILTDACPAQTKSINQSTIIEDKQTHSDKAKKFDWNETKQGIILGAFFWGYVLFQIPGGRMAEMYGPRFTVISLSIIGGAIGTIITSALSGHLAKNGFAGCLKAKKDQNVVEEQVKKKKPFPWIKVLTSRALLSEIAVKICTNWVYSLVLLKGPAYMDAVLSMPLETIGYYSAVMSFTSGISHFLSGVMADYLIRIKLFGSKTNIRKIFQGVCVFGTVIFICLIPSTNCDQKIFLLIMICSQVTFGFEAGGELPLPSDLSNEYSATLFAICNMFGMITAFVGPYLTGIVLDMEPNRPKRQWSYVGTIQYDGWHKMKYESICAIFWMYQIAAQKCYSAG